jgi:hypothetical protein
MSNLKLNGITKYHLLVLPMTAFVMLGAIACETPQQASETSNPAAQATTVSITNTPVAAATATELAFRSRALSEPPSVILNNERNPTVQASDDATTKNYADMLTQTALTPPPTIDRNVLPTDTPMPTPTAGAGFYQCPSLANMQNNITYTCGYWLVNGALVGAKSGRQGRSGDVLQGYLEVACIGQDTGTYYTPAKVGAVLIDSVAGTRFHLTAYARDAKPNSFIFDIATCQWVSP